MNQFKLLFTTILFFTSTFCFAQQNLDVLIKEAAAKEKLFLEEAALTLYQQLLAKNPKQLIALQRASLLCSNIGIRQSGKTKATYFAAGKTYADKALELQPNDCECLYVKAVSLGRNTLIGSTKDKVANSRALKGIADKIVTLYPNYSYGWNLLGRYHMEVSQLGILERTAAEKVLGGLPKGDLQTAINCFEKCKALDPGFLTNLLDLGIAYNKQGNNSKSKVAVQAAIAAKPRYLLESTEKLTTAKKLLASL